MNFTGKWTLITGASSGIGKATAEMFARAGSNVVLLARNRGNLEEICSRIEESTGVKAIPLTLDVTDTEETISAILSFCEHTPVDIAIINHGIGQYGRFAHSPWEDIEPVLATNIQGAIAVANAVVPQMVARRSGSVVFLSTILDKRPIPNHAAYSASKSAIRTFANVLRMELKEHGIHIGVLSPSRTDTTFREKVRYSEEPSPSVVSVTSTTESVAKDILRMVSRRQREVTSSFTGKAYVFFGYHFPRLSDWLIARVVPKPGGAK